MPAASDSISDFPFLNTPPSKFFAKKGRERTVPKHDRPKSFKYVIVMIEGGIRPHGWALFP